MKIGFIGTRGIPARYGGYETFVQELAPFLVVKGIECIVYCDRDSFDKPVYKGVHLKYLNITKSKSPLKYYFKSLKQAAKECDILYVAGTGGALFYSFFKSKKSIIITNTDGIEHRRDKWSFAKKLFIKILEFFAVKFSDYIVADSIGIKKYLVNRYKVKSDKIIQLEYGAYLNNYKGIDVLREYGIEHNKYYLVVSRLEPENNVHLMIEGYLLSSQNIPLIIIGNLQENSYVNKLLSKASDNIRFLGGVYDANKLNAIRFSCFAHIHGHSVGGTNPSLLEALGSSNIIIAHDNIFNREVAGNSMYYFKCPTELNFVFQELQLLNSSEKNELSKISQNRIKEYYNWDSIRIRYYNFFEAIAVKHNLKKMNL